jgi:hypothetical protein
MGERMSNETFYGSINRIKWFLAHSPSAYEEYRDILIPLRIFLVNMELRYQEVQPVRKRTFKPARTP